MWFPKKFFHLVPNPLWKEMSIRQEADLAKHEKTSISWRLPRKNVKLPRFPKSPGFLLHRYLSRTSLLLSASFPRLHICLNCIFSLGFWQNRGRAVPVFTLKFVHQQWFVLYELLLSVFRLKSVHQKDLYYMSCYYLCLDWNLFSINYLEDLHKLLPSHSSSFRDNNDPESCK